MACDVCGIIQRETGQSVTPDTAIEALNVDSLEFVDLMMVLGEAAGRDIPTKQLAALKTVGDIALALALMVTFQYEKWSGCVDEMRPLWPEHYAELALNQDSIELACDESKYEEGERVDCLHIVTARSDGALVGYYFGLLMNHLHYKNAGLMCYTDVYYLKPEYRKGNIGIRFLVAIQESLKLRGVVKLYMSTKAHQDHGELLEALGMKLSDHLFTKML